MAHPLPVNRGVWFGFDTLLTLPVFGPDNEESFLYSTFQAVSHNANTRTVSSKAHENLST